MIAKKPLVFLLSEEPKSARAVELLLGDWGYGVEIGSLPLPIAPSAVRSERAVAIIIDLVHTAWEHCLEQALALREHAEVQLPILILCPHGPPKMTSALPRGVTAFEKPVEPIKLREWLWALRERAPKPSKSKIHT